MTKFLVAAATTALLLTAPPAEAKRQLPDRVPNPCAPSGPPQTVPGQGGVRR